MERGTTICASVEVTGMNTPMPMPIMIIRNEIMSSGELAPMRVMPNSDRNSTVAPNVAQPR